MKFNCRPFEDERVRLETWHRWFAWFPVRVAPYDCRWLETVERKGAYISFYKEWNWEYRV